MYLFDCGLESEEWRKVMVIFTSIFVIFSVALYTTLTWRNKKWIVSTLIASFLIAVFGYEIWINFGLVDGQHVSARRSDALNCAIPSQINWLTNSIVDTGVAWLGIILVGIYYKNSPAPFEKFLWPAFFILLTWFLAQNIWVEVILYFGQVGGDTRLSWAPLMPLGPWFNPILFSFGEREISFQGQSPWIIVTPIYYYLMIYFYKKTGGK